MSSNKNSESKYKELDKFIKEQESYLNTESIIKLIKNEKIFSLENEFSSIMSNIHLLINENQELETRLREAIKTLKQMQHKTRIISEFYTCPYCKESIIINHINMNAHNQKITMDDYDNYENYSNDYDYD